MLGLRRMAVRSWTPRINKVASSGLRRFSSSVQAFNVLSGKVEELPRVPQGKSLSWYMCGPTVYDVAHLGHARFVFLLLFPFISCSFLRLTNPLLREFFPSLFPYLFFFDWTFVCCLMSPVLILVRSCSYLATFSGPPCRSTWFAASSSHLALDSVSV